MKDGITEGDLDVFALTGSLLLTSGLNAIHCFSETAQHNGPHGRLFRFLTAVRQGKPVEKTAGINFSIYKYPFQGAPLCMETQNVRINEKGNYSVQLGAPKSQVVTPDSGIQLWNYSVQVKKADWQAR